MDEKVCPKCGSDRRMPYVGKAWHIGNTGKRYSKKVMQFACRDCWWKWARSFKIDGVDTRVPGLSDGQIAMEILG